MAGYDYLDIPEDLDMEEGEGETITAKEDDDYSPVEESYDIPANALSDKKKINAKTEEIILSALINNADYLAKTITYFVPNIFEQEQYNIIFTHIKNWYNKYSNVPDIVGMKHDIYAQLEKSSNEVLKSNMDKAFNIIESIDVPDNKWLYETSEKWIRYRRIHLALAESISIYNEKGKHKVPIEAVPRILEEAIAVSFDNHIGMDWFTDREERYNFYSNPEFRTKCGIDTIDKRTGGGIPSKTLNAFLASTNVGKTMLMCALAACYMQLGHDVVYITLEMREEEILKRIDANLLDIPLDDFPKLEKEVFYSKINRLSEKHLGKLIVKEFPAHLCNVNNIRKLLKDITTQNFGKAPKIIMVDYMGLMSSTRLSPGVNKHHEILKSISEELRALMMEEDMFCWTGIQVNRSGTGNGNNSVELNQIAGSFDVAQTLDYCLSLWTTPEAEQQNVIYAKEVKSRYGNKADCQTLAIGIDKTRQRMFDATSQNLERLEKENIARPIEEERINNINAKLFSSIS